MWRILQVQGLGAHSTTQLKVGLRYHSLSDKFEDIVEVAEVLLQGWSSCQRLWTCPWAVWGDEWSWRDAGNLPGK